MISDLIKHTYKRLHKYVDSHRDMMICLLRTKPLAGIAEKEVGIGGPEGTEEAENG